MDKWPLDSLSDVLDVALSESPCEDLGMVDLPSLSTFAGSAGGGGDG
jgi:hypothetical protein